VADPTGGLHVHVGMPDAETRDPGVQRACAVTLPLLQALSANLAVPPRARDNGPGLGRARS